MNKNLEDDYIELSEIMDILRISMKKLSKCDKNPFRKIEFRFLHIIKENNGISMHDLGEELGVTKPRITAITSKLLENSLIYIDIDKKDKRKKILKLTEKGNEAIRAFKNEHKKFFIKILSIYDKDEINQWKNLMNKMIVMVNNEIKILEKDGENDETI
ncbi:MarR family transcriptional regulator [Pseudostreptobacillus hongkongensis]|uniref:MarR family winged helix-turn-helix transcriptional regulator n=1 Tax=Pseudostreptobacillus hongkongensis TaxID=1162717 RepID=UPI0028D6DAB0|nr:MarR family transcriptional regulator [Pseudostreptobacillus hongkongensis]